MQNLILPSSRLVIVTTHQKFTGINSSKFRFEQLSFKLLLFILGNLHFANHREREFWVYGTIIFGFLRIFRATKKEEQANQKKKFHFILIHPVVLFGQDLLYTIPCSSLLPRFQLCVLVRLRVWGPYYWLVVKKAKDLH